MSGAGDELPPLQRPKLPQMTSEARPRSSQLRISLHGTTFNSSVQISSIGGGRALQASEQPLDSIQPITSRHALQEVESVLG
jgi:hypothetical protein